MSVETLALALMRVPGSTQIRQYYSEPDRCDMVLLEVSIGYLKSRRVLVAAKDNPKGRAQVDRYEEQQTKFSRRRYDMMVKLLRKTLDE